MISYDLLCTSSSKNSNPLKVDNLFSSFKSISSLAADCLSSYALETLELIVLKSLFWFKTSLPLYVRLAEGGGNSIS